MTPSQCHFSSFPTRPPSRDTGTDCRIFIHRKSAVKNQHCVETARHAISASELTSTHALFSLLGLLTLWVKKQGTKLLPITLPNINRFPFFFADILSGKCVPNSYLHIPPHLKYVATLPCEIWMSENWWESEIYIVINDKWQRSVAKHLSCDVLLHYKYIA